jgi:ankyrin repeat protein
MNPLLQRHGFTARELLWSVTAILVIAAIMLPLADNARERRLRAMRKELVDAASNDDVQAIERLLRRGARIDDAVPDPFFPSTALRVATMMHRDHNAVQALVEHGANVNACSPGETPPLARVAYYGETELVRLMLRHGADPNRPGSETALLQAIVHRPHPETARVLLEAGADPNQPNGGGQLPLNWAVRNGYYEVVEVLLQYGADTNRLSGPREAPMPGDGMMGYGRTALHECPASPEFVKLLLDHGADPSLRDADGKTPLDRARESRSPSAREVVELLEAASAQ